MLHHPQSHHKEPQKSNKSLLDLNSSYLLERALEAKVLS